jgi:uncharacterized SAM-binding protein YcdF (DUF218 family)
MHHQLQKADAIFVLCSMDTRVASRAAELYEDGYGDYVIISGGFGSLTTGLFAKPEAEVFADILQADGVPQDKIILENKSSNTGENIIFTYELLQNAGQHFNSFILVQKPYMERRTYATFKKQWPGKETKIQVTSPDIAYDDYFDEKNNKELVLNVMVGDLQRIKEYPKLGFQIEQDIPEDVWSAYESLVKAGYTKHLISPLVLHK